MNDVSLTQFTSFVLENWWWGVPVLYAIALNTAWLISGITTGLYNFVFRQDKQEYFIREWDFDEEGVWGGWCLGVAVCLVVVFGFIHVTPTWFIYTLIIMAITLFTARAAVDGLRKSKEVLEALEEHKQDKLAHQEEK